MAVSQTITDATLALVGKYLTNSTNTSLKARSSSQITKMILSLLSDSSFAEWYETHRWPIVSLWNAESQLLGGVSVTPGDFACSIWFTFHEVSK